MVAALALARGANAPTARTEATPHRERGRSTNVHTGLPLPLTTCGPPWTGATCGCVADADGPHRNCGSSNGVRIWWACGGVPGTLRQPVAAGRQHRDVQPTPAGDLTHDERLGERGRRSRSQRRRRRRRPPSRRFRWIEAEAQRLLFAERHQEHEVHVVDLVALDDGRVAPSAASEDPPRMSSSRSPWSTASRIDRHPGAAPGSPLEVLDLVSRSPGPAARRSRGSSRTRRCSTEIVGNVAGSMSSAARSRMSDGVGHDTPRAGAPATTMLPPTTTSPQPIRRDADDRRKSTGAGSLRQSDGEPPELVRRRPRRGASRSRIGRAGAHDDETAEQGHLGPELVGLGGDQQRAGHADERRRTAPGRPARRARSSGR